MFGTILLTAAAVMTAYVFWRMGGAPFLSRFTWKYRLVTGAAIWLLIWLGREYGHDNAGRLPALAELVGMDLLIVMFLGFLLLLVVDVLTLFGALLPRYAPLLRGGALLACLTLSLLAMAQGMRAPVVEEYEVTLPGLPPESDGLVLVGMSDLHIGSQLGAGWLEERIAQAAALDPDVVVLLGDIFEGHHLPREELLPVLETLRAPLGVYAVQGNHEHYGQEDAPLQLMADAGLDVLLDEWAEPAPGLILAGVSDLTINLRRGGGSAPLLRTLAGRPQGATVLLSHTPLLAEEAASQGVGLMLSGHTHGGQVWPFGHLVKLRYPLLDGRYQVGAMTAIVSRGAGTWGPRMRLWKPGSILKITLRSGQLP